MALKKVFEYSLQNDIKPDFLIVIGSKTSSNSNKLAELGDELGKNLTGSSFVSCLTDNLCDLKEKRYI